MQAGIYHNLNHAKAGCPKRVLRVRVSSTFLVGHSGCSTPATRDFCSRATWILDMKVIT